MQYPHEDFQVKNGVRQNGIVSPVLFCTYIDGLLCAIRESGVGCYNTHVFVGAPLMLMMLLSWHRRHKPCGTCLKYVKTEEYGRMFSIVFNATKSAWLHVSSVIVGILSGHSTVTTCQGSSLLQGIPCLLYTSPSPRDS